MPQFLKSTLLALAVGFTTACGGSEFEKTNSTGGAANTGAAANIGGTANGGTSQSSGGSSGTGGAQNVAGGPSSGGTTADCGTTCEDCFMCPASIAACEAHKDDCTTEPDCATFRACVGESDNADIVQTCTVEHPAGAAAFCAYWGCLTYTRCDAVCEDAVICPRP